MFPISEYKITLEKFNLTDIQKEAVLVNYLIKQKQKNIKELLKNYKINNRTAALKAFDGMLVWSQLLRSYVTKETFDENIQYETAKELLEYINLEDILINSFNNIYIGSNQISYRIESIFNRAIGTRTSEILKTITNDSIVFKFELEKYFDIKGIKIDINGNTNNELQNTLESI